MYIYNIIYIYIYIYICVWVTTQSKLRHHLVAPDLMSPIGVGEAPKDPVLRDRGGGQGGEQQGHVFFCGGRGSGGGRGAGGGLKGTRHC